MKITQTWTRNTPSSAGGYSITVNITYSSFDKNEIDEIEKKLPNGMIVSETATTGEFINEYRENNTGMGTM